MKITNDWLKEKEACDEVVKWFNSQKETDGLAIVKKLLVEDRGDWANWVICRMFDRRQRIQYAIYDNKLWHRIIGGKRWTIKPQ